MAKSHEKAVWWFLTTEHTLTIQLTNTFLVTYPHALKTSVRTNTCAKILTAALFILAKLGGSHNVFQ